MTRDQIAALAHKVACASLGHDSLGPTGLVVYLTPEERGAIVAALTSAPMKDGLSPVWPGRGGDG